eukprot:5957923-Amphidinium_carterae.1
MSSHGLNGRQLFPDANEGQWAQVECLLTTAHSMPKDFVLQLLSGKLAAQSCALSFSTRPQNQAPTLPMPK